MGHKMGINYIEGSGIMRKCRVIMLIFLIFTMISATAQGSFGLSSSDLYDFMLSIEKKTIGDEITTKDYGELDQTLQTILEVQGYSEADIRSVVEAKLSLATQAASATLVGANLISVGADTGISYAKDGLTAAIKSLLISAGQNVVSNTGTSGKFLIRFYTLSGLKSSYDELQQIKKAAETTEDFANAAVNAQWLAADFASYILSEEMNYINQNMDMAFRDIWKFNPGSSNRLKIYAVHIEKYYPAMSYTERGIRFYYWRESDSRYVNYFDDLVFTEYEAVVDDNVTDVSMTFAEGLKSQVMNKKWKMVNNPNWFLNLYDGQMQMGYGDDVMRIKQFEIEAVDMNANALLGRVLEEINYDGMVIYCNYPISIVIGPNQLRVEEFSTTSSQVNTTYWER